MVLNIRKHLIPAAAVLLTAGLSFMHCSVDDIPRPAPRIDLRYDGSELYSDTLTIVAATSDEITVYLYAVGGLKSHSITLDDEPLSDETYDDSPVPICDTVMIGMQFSGSTPLNRVLSVTATDWQDQTSTGILVIVYNPGGVLVVRPTFVSSPSDAQVEAGDQATFTAVATGNYLSYQWQKDGADISGANDNTYTTPPAQSGDDGAEFRCIVRNSAGRDTSDAATLTVITITKPAITVNPQNTTVVEGQNASFSVAATGYYLDYQWQKDNTDIPDANDDSYTTQESEIGDDGARFRCIVSNSAGSDTTDAATLTVTPVVAPAITADPQDRSIGAGETATFTVQATGTSPVYQWQKNGSNITGARDNSYTTPQAELIDNGNEYRCIVTNSAGSDTSGIAVLTVSLLPPAITSHPQDAAVSAGQRAVFQVYASGYGLSYQWQKNGVDINGAVDNTYTTPVTASMDDGSLFRCIVSNSAGSDTSDAATLTVAQLDPPEITADPQDITVTAGETATFTVTASGTSPGYQWQKDGENITGAQYSSYTTPATVVGDSGAQFRCIVSNGAGSDTTDAATLFVLRPPVATIGQNYQGGIVFYLDNTGQHGLIAAQSDLSDDAEWGCDGTDIGGTDADTGTGQANTVLIVNGCGTPGIAARLCAELTSGGYSDWYLPSKDELNMLYQRKSSVGSFNGDAYWSSTENNSSTAALQIFIDGYQVNASKSTGGSVRAIRSF